MKTQSAKSVLVLVATLFAYSAMAQDSDEELETGEREWSQLEPPTSCSCPKEGRWDVRNLEGWMDCTGPINFRNTLGDDPKDKGTIWVLENDCSSLFGEASKRKDENVLLDKVEDCSFFGAINGEEDGIKMVLEVKWVADGDEFIRGEMHSNPSLQGMTCEYYRPFEITFREPIKEKDYEKAKKNMEKKLEKARQKS